MSVMEKFTRETITLLDGPGMPMLHIPTWRHNGMAAVPSRGNTREGHPFWGIVDIERQSYGFAGAVFWQCEEACAAILALDAAGVLKTEADAWFAVEIIHRNGGACFIVMSEVQQYEWWKKKATEAQS